MHEPHFVASGGSAAILDATAICRLVTMFTTTVPPKRAVNGAAARQARETSSNRLEFDMTFTEVPDHDHSDLPDNQRRILALETILTRKGYLDATALEEVIDLYENKIGPRNGAIVVAKAWVDPEFKAWLLRDGTTAIASLGFGGRQGEHMVVLQNTPDVHNLVVCTLCSCYPWPVLGLPPAWYKSNAYRARAVIEPRKVLAEFGTTLPDSVEIHVWDSNSEVRYLVLPMRPGGTEAWTEEQLRELVTRNSMIGTATAMQPEARA